MMKIKELEPGLLELTPPDVLRSWGVTAKRERRVSPPPKEVSRPPEPERPKERNPIAPEVKESLRYLRIEREYGLTRAQYEGRVAAQQGVCIVCEQPPGGRSGLLQVDHDHETERVRDLLCGKCNTALGMVGDSIELLSKLIRYLERHGKAEAIR